MGQDEMRKNKKCNLFIDGKRIYLREIRLSDVNRNYCDWMNDPEVTQYTESRFENWSLRKLKDYVRKIKSSPDCIFFAIISKHNNKHIGNIKIGPIDKNHNFADVGIIIGEKSFWGKGFATEAIKLVVDYAFNKLNLHKLTAGVYANNIGSIKAFKKAGFSIEGVRKKHYLYKGNYIDATIMGIIAET